MCLLLEATTYIFLIAIDEKDMKGSVVYLIYPANSNSRENSVFSLDFSAFCRILNFFSAYNFTCETGETAVDQRNSSIIGRDKIYISSK